MDEEETVLLTFSFSEIRDWATGCDTSGTSGWSGISKDTAKPKQNKVKCMSATANRQHFYLKNN